MAELHTLDFLEDMDPQTAQLILQLQLEDVADLGIQQAPRQVNREQRNQPRAIERDDWERLTADLADTRLADGFNGVRGTDTARGVPVNAVKRACTVCLDEDYEINMAELTCGCNYCAGCFTEFFDKAMKDETMIPLHCHKLEIDINNPSLHGLVSPEMKSAYAAKVVEVSTKDRTYCANRACLAFIPPREIVSTSVACKKCYQVTCVGCKGRGHTGVCVKENDGETELKELATSEKWQTCPDCKRIIELSMGCFHMTCHCGMEFCYLCQKEWKSCRCPNFAENHLLNEPGPPIPPMPQPRNRRVNGAFPPVFLVQAVREPMAHLEQMLNHPPGRIDAGNRVCNHRDAPMNMIRIHEGNLITCNICDHDMPGFIYQCRQCGAHICRRCRLNQFQFR